MLIFERSQPGRRNEHQAPRKLADTSAIPAALKRCAPPMLPDVSELEAVRHYTRLSQKNFSIDTHFYPLGSCTMKYNPRACNSLAMLPQFLARHPLAPAPTGQGFLACLYELQEMLKDVTGMAGVSLTPMAGAQGEFAGVAMIRAYHESRAATRRATRSSCRMPPTAPIRPRRPCAATRCARSRPIADGDVDLEALRAAVGPHTAGHHAHQSVDARRVRDGASSRSQRIVHDAGGLLYYDGANLNAILGKVRPGDMGFDVIHMNLHKTFSTPHGGGGPGAGAVGVGERLLPFLPVPIVGSRRRRLPLARRAGPAADASAACRPSWAMPACCCAPTSTRACSGREGMRRVAEFATLNANYLMARPARGPASSSPIPSAAPATSSSSRCKQPKRGNRRHRDGLRQAPARLRLSRADDLLPAAGAGVPADRADRDRDRRKTLDAFVEAMARDSATRRGASPSCSRARPTPCRCAVSTTSRPHANSTSSGG